MSTTAPHKRENPFQILFWFLLAMFIVEPFLREQRWGGLALRFVFIGLLLTASFTVWSRRGRNWLFVVVILAAAVLSLVSDRSDDTAGMAAAGIAALFLGYCVARIFRIILAAPRVTTDKLMGAMAVYILMAYVWSLAYVVVLGAEPAAFKNLPEGRSLTLLGSDLIYFSIVTQTTLGYGDVVPLTTWARSLTSLQAIVGQLFLTVIVARLVALHITHDRRTAPETTG